jgi:hypothetical protein
MEEHDGAGMRRGAHWSFHGNLSEQELSADFCQDTVSIRQDGFDLDQPDFSMPSEMRLEAGGEATAAIDPQIWYIGLTVFLAEWGAGKLLDKIWEQRIQPAVSRFFEKFKRKRESVGALRVPHFVFARYVEADGVYLRVFARLANDGDRDAIDTLVPIAYRRLEEYAKVNSLRDCVVTARIQDKILSPDYQVTRDIPDLMLI